MKTWEQIINKAFQKAEAEGYEIKKISEEKKNQLRNGNLKS